MVEHKTTIYKLYIILFLKVYFIQKVTTFLLRKIVKAFFLLGEKKQNVQFTQHDHMRSSSGMFEVDSSRAELLITLCEFTVAAINGVCFCAFNF